MHHIISFLMEYHFQRLILIFSMFFSVLFKVNFKYNFIIVREIYNNYIIIIEVKF